jgi:hypothetical protein
MHKDSLFSDNKYTWEALSCVFENMLRDPRLFEVYFIVNALDKCDDGLRNLILLISTSLKLSKKIK